MLHQVDIQSKSLINLIQQEGFVISILPNRKSLRKRCEERKPFIFITDPFAENTISIEFLDTLTEVYKELKIILVTSKEYLSSRKINDIIESDFSALLSSSDEVSLLKKVIQRTAESDEKHYSDYFLNQICIENQCTIARNNFDITEKEKEIIVLVSRGLTTKEISEKLNRSIHTITTHRRNILKKMDTRNTGDMLNIAIKEQII